MPFLDPQLRARYSRKVIAKNHYSPERNQAHHAPAVENRRAVIGGIVLFVIIFLTTRPYVTPYTVSSIRNRLRAKPRAYLAGSIWPGHLRACTAPAFLFRLAFRHFDRHYMDACWGLLRAFTVAC